MTSVHTRYDTRIFVKECCSLASVDNHIVNLIVADGKGYEMRNNVHIHDVGQPSGRLNRVLKTTKKVLRKAVELDSDIYHFHDPELIPTGVHLAKSGKKVIFDVHENITQQIRKKNYLPYPAREFLSSCYNLYERSFLKYLTLILAENSYEEHYKELTNRYTTVLNMPQADFFQKFIVDSRNKVEFFYIGGISEIRGVYLILDALMILHKKGIAFKMHFIGSNYGIKIKMEKYKAIKTAVIFHGHLELVDGYKVSKNCIVGLSILKPIDNYVTSYSTKIFEYMAVKLPVITSNFPLYQDIVEKYNCGLCVDPLDPEAIANALLYIINNPEIARLMAENGKQAVDQHFNWDLEEKKLSFLYRSLDNIHNNGIQITGAK